MNINREINSAAIREYNEFGPWIMEVKTPEEMPPLFQDYYEEHANANFLLKIPRNEERRNLKAGMDLYKSILAVHEDKICLMTKAGSNVELRRVNCKNIQAIQIYQNLLDGRLKLFMSDGSSFDFAYNAVSQALMESIVEFLRQRFPKSVNVDNLRSGKAVEVMSYNFRSQMTDQLRTRPDSLVFYSEADGRVCQYRFGLRRYFLGILILVTAQDLVVINKGKTMRRRRETVYANQAMYIPWTLIKSFNLVTDQADKHVSYQTIHIELENHVLKFELLEPETLLELLNRILPGGKK